MTICIAALCDQGKNCVVAADREITATGLNLEFDHEKKIEVLTDASVVMASGDSLLAAEIIEKTRPLVTAPGNNTIRNIAETLRDVYIRTHIERAESVFLRPRGLTLQEFQQNGAQCLPRDIYATIDNQFFAFGLNVVEFLVAGVDVAGAHIFRVYYSGVAGGSWLEWCDRLGYRAIGTGAMHSSILLSLVEHNRTVNADRAIYNVYSAKRSAEVAPGVGLSTDLAVITSSGISFLKSEVLKKLSQIREEVIKRSQPNPEAISGLHKTAD
jgi:20S proteasome alpha/beta subunit